MTKRKWSNFCLVIGVFVVLNGGVLLSPVNATHEVHHRFTVTGYVRDANGRPISGERVIIVDTRLDMAATTFTDGDGYYESLLHLHNDDVGDEVAIMVGEQKKTIRAEWDPEDKKTERRVRVDFGAPATVGEESGALGQYGVIALVALGLVVAFGTLRYMKRGRQRQKKRAKTNK